MSDIYNPEQIREVLEKYNIGIQKRDSQFFINGNACLPKFVKHGIVRQFDLEDDDLDM